MLPVMLQTFITRRAFTGHLGTKNTLEHSKGTQSALQRHCKSTWGIKALGNLGTRRFLGTWALEHLKHSYVLRHLSTQALEALEALYLAKII